MYQPKIREDLIPRLYRMARARGIPMTRLVSELLEAALEQLERGGEGVSDPPVDYEAQRHSTRKGRRRP